jgi:vancomycin resistance protein VanJ
VAAPKPRSPSRDLIVRCDGAGHKVRLRGGRRFFHPARCPKCRAPVDPSRLQRSARLLNNLSRPVSPHPLDRGVWIGALGILGVTLATVVIFRTAADLWWPATVLLFGPRWTLLLPIAPLVALSMVRDRTLLIPLTLASLLVLGPIMGFQTNLASSLTWSQEGDLVVVTFNAAGGRGLQASVRSMLSDWRADIAAFQECGPTLARQFDGLEGWHSQTRETLCFVSRFEILDVIQMDREVLESVGGSGLVATITIAAPGGPVRVTNIHLETPRDGLELIRNGRVGLGAEILRQKSLLREIELRRAGRWAERSGAPAIVLGDFNTPIESRHYERTFSGWTNAFSAAGFGVGGTRQNGWISARIDHILLDDSWTVVASWAGEELGSDHLPMIARVRRR